MSLERTSISSSFGYISGRTSKEKGAVVSSEMCHFCLQWCLKFLTWFLNSELYLNAKNCSAPSFSSWGTFLKSISAVSVGRADGLPEPSPKCHWL